jgi:hypothetical protein
LTLKSACGRFFHFQRATSAHQIFQVSKASTVAKSPSVPEQVQSPCKSKRTGAFIDNSTKAKGTHKGAFESRKR